MSPYTSHEALCSQVEMKLSALLDGELTELERLSTQRHLESCASCRQQFARLGEISDVLRQGGPDVPAPPTWPSVREALEESHRPTRADRRGFRFAGPTAASVGILALAGFLFAVALAVRTDRTKTAGPLAAAEVQLAGLPGLERFLTDHRAEEVTAVDLIERVGFSPDVPAELPGGFRLQRAYVVQDLCCAGSCLIYRRDDELVTLVQHPPSHPVSWGNGDLEDCTVAGFACRRTRGRDVEILQIEPQGRNLTLVSRVGVIDPAVFVSALSDR
ncbi:MAG: zf-HC2 domain-containing protein [Acidobacteria bacterium]|nr:zf-HC2 domain-containing protein [Acidobacteriota bacterium]